MDYFGLIKLHEQVKSELERRGEAGKNFLGQVRAPPRTGAPGCPHVLERRTQFSNLALRALDRALASYRTSNAFLGEAALALVQSAKYDIPALQRTVKQSEQEIAAVARKQKVCQSCNAGISASPRHCSPPTPTGLPALHREQPQVPAGGVRSARHIGVTTPTALCHSLPAALHRPQPTALHPPPFITLRPPPWAALARSIDASPPRARTCPSLFCGGACCCS